MIYDNIGGPGVGYSPHGFKLTRSHSSASEPPLCMVTIAVRAKIIIIFSRTDLRKAVSGAKFDAESDFEVRLAVALPKSIKNYEKLISETEKFPIFFLFGVKKSKVANLPKRALPKFRADRSHVRGVNGRSKFVATSAGFAKRKQL